MNKQSFVCPAELNEAVKWMLHELDSTALHVGLIPAPEQRHCGHCVRVVWTRNPGWYRDLLAMFPRRRRRRRGERYTDSTVKRAHVRRALLALLQDGSRSHLAEPLLGFAKDVRENMETEVETAFDDVTLAFGPFQGDSASVVASGF